MYNKLFPSVKLTISDIISSWAGLRPLIHEDGKSPSELSRKDEIFYAESGLISIAGGKLTGFRKMAERVVNVVIKQLYIETDRPVDYCVTDTIKIGGGNFKKTEDVQEFIWDLSEEYAPLTISKTQLENLVYKYGRYTTDILDFFEKETSNKLSITERLLKAELQYAVKNEMVHTLSDFTIRRTGRLYFERPQLDNIVFFLLDELADILALTKQEKLKQYSEFEKEYKAVLQFKQTANS